VAVIQGKEKTILVGTRVPASLYRELEQEAANSDSTMTRIVIQALRSYIGEPCPSCRGTGVIPK
jgi:hypothetical protein